MTRATACLALVERYVMFPLSPKIKNCLGTPFKKNRDARWDVSILLEIRLITQRLS